MANLYGIRAIEKNVLTLQHMTAPELLRAGLIDEHTLQSYFKFTVIREPFDRMASDFFWQKQHDAHGEFEDLGFTAYLEKAKRIVSEKRFFEKRHYDHFRPMTDYCINEGKLLVDDILRLEYIEDELTRIADYLGNFQLPHLNHVRSYDELRTTENIERVHELYAGDKLLHDNVEAILGR
ncbi:hypothetical protein NOR51B_193 [Luminiphilus syltensis NOR5-1B]|uniref:Sulfotransferase family protein n=2 Tax=Luminiphilus TaxID=1341118 RepID=B8KYM9_9GAMM|nr:hypothetical protein NOR51B_193 [Luminiphilus syltensis NOR5-1B]